MKNMTRKIVSVLASFTLTASVAANAFAVSDNVYSAEPQTIREMIMSMSDSEKTAYINENLDIKLQHLSTLVTLTSNRRYDKIADEIKAALDDGITVVEIKEAIYHSGAYCGLTRAAGALDAADKALKDLGQDTAYQSCITWNEDERYAEGLATQRYLFGQQIGTVTEDMESSLKLQTVLLSGICFGDFYNRSGLPLYTREFLTLCTIAANGNCRGQLTGHVNGNLNVGHSKDMLRAAMLLNEEYNGIDKTQLAFEVINSVETETAVSPAPEPPTPTDTITTSYKSDAEEILAIADHFKTDDADGYVNKNLDAKTQEILINATTAVIDETTIPTSDDKATQLLIDLAVMTAQGGRESELAEKIAEGYAAGLTKDNMLAVPLLTAPYNGFPRTLNMRGSLAAEIENTQTIGTEKTVVTMQIGNPAMTVNGKGQSIDAEGTVPVVRDDRTLLPVRAFVEGIGGSVLWDEAAQTAVLNYNGDEIRLTINSRTAYLNNKASELDVTPVIINDRTMLPIRFVAESFGYTVLWNQDTQTVTIINADKIENVFAKGDVNPASPKFTGVSYMNWLTSYDETLKIPAFGQVTFEPCTRTDWHYHDGGQILLVTEGVGVFEMEGEATRIMQAGDVILIPPGKKHMHAAINDSHFAHIAIGVNPGVGTTNWLDKVTDDEYNAAVATARANGTIREKGATMFPMGDVFTADGYTGTVHKNLLVENESVFNCPEVNNYTFEAGARTAWHSHEGGQLIIVTDGTGFYQEEGGDVRIIKAGDVITAQPGIKHWHGAANEQFAYIAVNGNPGNDTVTWSDAVSDEEYNSVKAGNGIAVVNTNAGQVQGYISDGTYTYHGIPYAEADERFVAAHEVETWEGVKTAYSYGAIAPQAGNNLPAMDENCQNLNIWTPAVNDGEKRPVMVWLHGGGFSTGSSIESPAYDGENLSKKGDVVVVSINHRLNSLGHIDLSAFDEKYKYSANIGIQDIIDALKWIQTNIDKFGGDPNNVTVFGESGGGAKVLALMTSPYAKGLFHKGIVESGATENMGASFTSLEASRRVTEITLENLGITSDEIEKLQTIPYEDLTAASDKALVQAAEEMNIYEEFVNGYSLLWEPVVDGDFLPTSPVTESSFAENGKDIPLLIGTNLNEWTVFSSPMANPDEKLSESELNEKLKATYGENADKVKEAFKKAYPNESDTAALYIDTMIRRPILKLTAHKADQNGAPVYSYVFTYGTSYHTAEIPFVFNNIERSNITENIDEANKLSDIMSSAWINFAKTGNPNGGNVPEWEPYTRDNWAVMIFDNESYLAHNHDKELISILAPDYNY